MKSKQKVVKADAALATSAAQITDTAGLRRFLLDCMIATIHGTISAEQSRGVARLSQQIYNSAKLELTHAYATRALGKGKVNPVTLDA